MKIGLVLSGGGIKGVAHIGVIKALEENGIYPSHISGTSAGAIVGALYAYGYSPEAILEFFKITPLLNINKFTFSKPGFIDTDKFYDDFLKYFPNDNFNELKKTLFITSVDMLHGKIKVFEKGKLIKPLLASAAFPGIFSPVNINNIIYADGGILDNFPITPLEEQCDFLVGVYTNSLEKINVNALKHSYSVLDRAVRINFSKSSLLKASECSIFIYPKGLNKFGLFNKMNIDEIYKIGYKTALKNIEFHKQNNAKKQVEHLY